MKDKAVDVKDSIDKKDIVISPCCGVCALDDNDICIGCLRSGIEITQWGREDAEGKRAILQNVEERYRKQYS